MFAAGWPLLAATQPASFHGTVERIVVHGRSLEGNLEGDPADRQVTVYLPPSYPNAPEKRYPTVYFLHGFSSSDDYWFGRTREHGPDLAQIMDAAIASGQTREMMLVVPNALTRYYGSFFSRSATTGDWEEFIATDLVKAIDARYRTMPSAASRGLAGHSMGGYGALRIGAHHPEVFSALYLLSACCLKTFTNDPQAGKGTADASSGLSLGEIAETARGLAGRLSSVFMAPDLEADTGNHPDPQVGEFLGMTTLAMSAAWSPDPGSPPFYLDVPFLPSPQRTDILAKWAENMGLTIARQSTANLKELRFIGMDVGAQDELPQIPFEMSELDKLLKENRVPEVFEVYQGTHTDHIPERLEHVVLPFFSVHLKGF
ncbi:MAG TPA: alpha/beta hydrolase-fold protein [Bryobacteraceae bacterium]|jgi:enterochelin esterase-like enzyme|nr:alpha/beta hydrolase-fold protein [Bryobacteraceae bacterium]